MHPVTPAVRLGAQLLEAFVSIAAVGVLFALTRSPMVVSLAWIGVLGAQIYFWTRAQSIGKAILGLRVVSLESGEPLGFVQMLIRELPGKFISGLFLSIGYFWIIFDQNKQGWHDKFVGSTVIKD
jgi:uncharacterized RDD family membrane protein YckC